MKQIMKYPDRTYQKIYPDLDTNTDFPIRVRIFGQD